MKTNERLIFTIEDEYGNIHECEALLTFESETNGKHYIVYTTHEVDEDGNTMVFAGTYVPNLKRQHIKAIETDHEWKIIETVLERAMLDAKREESVDMEEDINNLLDELGLDFLDDINLHDLLNTDDLF